MKKLLLSAFTVFNWLLNTVAHAGDYDLIAKSLDQGGGVTQSTDYELAGSLTTEPSSPIVTHSTDYTIYNGYIGQLVNTPPIPAPDSVQNVAGGTVTVDVLLNDTDDEYDALTVSAAGPVPGGTVTILGGHSIRFVAGAGFTGTGVIPYTVTDSQGATATSTLTVTLLPFSTWKLTHIGDANSPDLGDPDGDGILTLAEYGLSLLPETPSVIPAVSALDYAEGRRLRMLIQRDPSHNDVTVEVQAAGSVSGPWTTVATSTLGSQFTGLGYVSGDSATTGVKTVEIRDIVNISDATARFLRVKVTH